MARATRPIADRFWEKVQATDSCWLWTGATKNGGYGVFQLGRGQGVARAHRWAYEQLIGPIPDGVFLCHHCDTPACVRPDHLFLGTARDNSHDMRDKGRAPGQRKTHCPQGHAYDEANTYVQDGRRRCRTCRRARRRVRKDRNGYWE